MQLFIANQYGEILHEQPWPDNRIMDTDAAMLEHFAESDYSPVSEKETFNCLYDVCAWFADDIDSRARWYETGYSINITD